MGGGYRISDLIPRFADIKAHDGWSTAKAAATVDDSTSVHWSDGIQKNQFRVTGLMAKVHRAALSNRVFKEVELAGRHDVAQEQSLANMMYSEGLLADHPVSAVASQSVSHLGMRIMDGPHLQLYEGCSLVDSAALILGICREVKISHCT
jgi:hypothetical protein